MAARKPKVAIVCDWLTGTGGAERVVLELHRMFPEAPIYTSQYNPDPKIWYNGDWFNDADVRTTWLQKLPTSLKKFLPALRAIAFSRLDLSEYDLVISSSGAEAKGIHTGPNTIHICYMHAPTHYYWSRYDDYIQNPGFGFWNWLARFGLRVLVGPLRQWDFDAAQKPDVLVANSAHIQDEIKKYYKRESTVVHPPIDTNRFKGGKEQLRHGFVIAGRQTPYKRFDLAIEACNQLNVPLVVIGNGPEHARLEKIAGRSIVFLTGVTDEQMADHFRTAKALIFPGLEDFGITPVEAMAAGTPVVAFQAGGALDYIQPGKTGVFFTKQTPESLAKALEQVDKISFKSDVLALQASRFNPTIFRKRMQQVIDAAKRKRN